MGWGWGNVWFYSEEQYIGFKYILSLKDFSFRKLIFSYIDENLGQSFFQTLEFSCAWSEGISKAPLSAVAMAGSVTEVHHREFPVLSLAC